MKIIAAQTEPGAVRAYLPKRPTHPRRPISPEFNVTVNTSSLGYVNRSRPTGLSVMQFNSISRLGGPERGDETVRNISKDLHLGLTTL
jgi:hypothetical protein